MGWVDASRRKLLDRLRADVVVLTAEEENLITSYKDLVSSRPNIHRTLCGCLVQSMCQ
jgi:hypothetical protein